MDNERDGSKGQSAENCANHAVSEIRLDIQMGFLLKAKAWQGVQKKWGKCLKHSSPRFIKCIIFAGM